MIIKNWSWVLFTPKNVILIAMFKFINWIWSSRYSVTDVTVDKLNLCVRCRVNWLNVYIDLYIVSDNKRYFSGKLILLIQQ